jgi:adenosylmethionine-8-amino-7-oxononanoate aminotransferase
VVYVLPPYAISYAELNFVYDMIEESLSLVANAG